MAGDLHIAVVENGAELRRFVNLPWRLYDGDLYWVPPLKRQVRGLLDRRHAFYANGAADRQLFLARRGDRVVGRVAAIVNRAYNAYHSDRSGFFGFFECEDDPAATGGLLGAAADWASQRGCTSLVGPVNPSTNYEAGLLVEGFDSAPTVMMTYNPRRYVELIEGAGFTKAKDLFAYASPVHPGSLDRLRRFAEKTREREPKLRTRPVELKEFAREVATIRDIYNSAWEKNWGFVPVSEGEFDALAHDLKPLVDPSLLRIAFIDETPAGFLLAVPDANPALAALDGSLANPIRLLRAMLIGRRREGLRLITMGVKEGFRLRGIEGVMFYEGLAAALERGYTSCEYSWILEDNELAKRTVRLMNATHTKTYRIYQRVL
jgi:hypothetical protein